MWVEWIKAWSNTSMNPQWIYVYINFCASSESNKCKANRASHYLTVFRRRRYRFVVVQHLWCRKICQIVYRVSRKRMKSKFLDQDVDVVSLANKGIVIGCFVGRNCNKILMETGKLTDIIRVTKNGLGSGVDRRFQSSDPAFYHFADRLNPFGKSVEFDILFLGPLKLFSIGCTASFFDLIIWCSDWFCIPSPHLKQCFALVMLHSILFFFGPPDSYFPRDATLIYYNHGHWPFIYPILYCIWLNLFRSRNEIQKREKFNIFLPIREKLVIWSNRLSILGRIWRKRHWMCLFIGMCLILSVLLI